MTTDSGMLRTLWTFRRYGRSHRRALTLGVACRLGELVADLGLPWPTAIVIDGVLAHRRLHGPAGAVVAAWGRSGTALLTTAAVASLLLVLTSSTFDYLGDRVMNSAGEQITASIRADLFRHLTRLPMVFHDRRTVGELTSRMSIDTDRIEDSLIDVFSTLVPGALTVAGLATAMLLLDWRLGLVAIASAPVVFLAAARYSKLTRSAARRRRAAEGKLSAVAAETMTGIRTVHATGSGTIHEGHFTTHNSTALAAGLRAVDLRARFTPLLEISAASGTAGLLWVGGYGALNGYWTPGILIVTLTYMRDLIKPMRSLSRLSMTLTTGAASAERVGEILDADLPGDGGIAPDHAQPLIELQNVTLDHGRGPVLDDVSLRVNPGERLALVGPNGAGKSSVIAVIARLYDPQSGQVRLGGHPLKSLDPTWLRSQVAVVLQDTFLFSGTIYDNVRYGRPAATEQEVLAACAVAGVLQFIPQLPDGLRTVLADCGLGLSGGQRQRVGIARALIQDAPVVLLDEPTSGLDEATERELIHALQHLISGRTVIMTTHRPALLQLADRQLTIRDGKLASQPEGTAEEGRPPSKTAQNAPDPTARRAPVQASALRAAARNCSPGTSRTIQMLTSSAPLPPLR